MEENRSKHSANTAASSTEEEASHFLPPLSTSSTHPPGPFHPTPTPQGLYTRWPWHRRVVMGQATQGSPYTTNGPAT